MRAWSFFVDPKVLEFPGVQYRAGDVVMGQAPRQNQFNSTVSVFNQMQPKQEEIKQPERLRFSIEERGKDLGLSLTRNKLFDQPIIQKWGIFYQSRDH